MSYPPPPPPPPVPPPPQPAAPPAKRINVRNKGQRGERQVVQLLQVVVDKVRNIAGLPPIVLQRNALQAHLGGEDIHGLDGFSVEVKWQETGFNPAWWRQCLAQAEAQDLKRVMVQNGCYCTVPILFYRASQQKWRVRFRAYVNTPQDNDQIEMDVETSVDDFIEWFGNAYAESISIPRT